MAKVHIGLKDNLLLVNKMNLFLTAPQELTEQSRTKSAARVCLLLHCDHLFLVFSLCRINIIICSPKQKSSFLLISNMLYYT